MAGRQGCSHFVTRVRASSSEAIFPGCQHHLACQRTLETEHTCRAARRGRPRRSLATDPARGCPPRRTASRCRRHNQQHRRGSASRQRGLSSLTSSVEGGRESWSGALKLRRLSWSSSPDHTRGPNVSRAPGPRLSTEAWRHPFTAGGRDCASPTRNDDTAGWNGSRPPGRTRVLPEARVPRRRAPDPKRTTCCAWPKQARGDLVSDPALCS